MADISAEDQSSVEQSASFADQSSLEPSQPSQIGKTSVEVEEKPHLTIFDTIRNKIASNSATCRTREELMFAKAAEVE